MSPDAPEFDQGGLAGAGKPRRTLLAQAYRQRVPRDPVDAENDRPFLRAAGGLEVERLGVRRRAEADRPFPGLRLPL